MSDNGLVRNRVLVLTIAAAFSGCATPAPQPSPVALPAPVADQTPVPDASAHRFKRKIAVGRFTNETNYGRALLSGDEIDPLGRQLTDVLSARLTDTGGFLVFERPDLNLVQSEQHLTGTAGNIVGWICWWLDRSPVLPTTWRARTAF